MQRWSLMILITWPLLMPPGFCICRMEAFMPHPAERPAVADVRDEAPPPGCRCCRRAGEPKIPTAKPSNCRADSCPTVPSPSEPHAPNCPASPAWEILRSGVFSPGGFDISGFHSLDLSVFASCPTEVDPPSSLTVPDAPTLPSSSLSLFSCNFRC